MAEFECRLKTYRQLKGLTQEQTARVVGVSQVQISRLERRGKLQFQADVVGSEDKGVIWSVKESNGGAIDHNGLYQASEEPGTYEIVAAARADSSVTASAFVIVE